VLITVQRELTMLLLFTSTYVTSSLPTTAGYEMWLQNIMEYTTLLCVYNLDFI